MKNRGLWIAGVLLIGIILWQHFTDPSLDLAEDSYERVRNDSGTFEDPATEAPLDEENLLSLKANAGVTRSASNKSYASNHTISDRSYYNLNTVAILAGDEKEMTQFIAQAFGQHLESIPSLERVIVVPFGKSLPAGNKLPQCFLRVSVDSMESGRAGFEKTLKTVARLEGGSSLMDNAFSFNDPLTSPGMDWSLDGNVEHSLSFKGVAIGQNLETVAGTEIAQAFKEQIEKKWKNLKEKMPHSGMLPDFFVPDYEKLPLPESLSKHEPEQIYSGSRVFVPFDSLWTFQLDPGEEAPLESIKSGLESSGLVVDRFETNPEATPSLRLKSPEKTTTIEIWKLSEDEGLIEPSDKDRYAIRYYKCFSEEQIHAALDQLLKEDLPIKYMALFKQHWEERHRDAFLESLDQKDVLHSASVLVTALETLESMGEKEAALRLLPRAYLYDQACGVKYENQIKRIGQRLHEDEEWKPSFPSDEEMVSLGIPELDDEGSDFPRPLNLGGVMLYRTMYHDGEQRLGFIRITDPIHNKEGVPQYTVHKGSIGDHSRSWGSQVTSLPHSADAGFVETEDGSKVHRRLVLRHAADSEGKFEIVVK